MLVKGKVRSRLRRTTEICQIIVTGDVGKAIDQSLADMELRESARREFRFRGFRSFVWLVFLNEMQMD